MIGSVVIHLTVVGEDSIVRIEMFSANEESMVSQEIDEIFLDSANSLFACQYLANCRRLPSLDTGRHSAR